MARKRLIAIPYSAAKFGVRLDYSPKFRCFVFYAWWLPRGTRSWAFGEIPFYKIWWWHVIRRHKMDLDVLEMNGQRKVRFSCSCQREWDIWL